MALPTSLPSRAGATTATRQRSLLPLAGPSLSPASAATAIGLALGEDSTWDDEPEIEVLDHERAASSLPLTKAPRRRGPGMKITDRDVALMQMLTRYRYATYPQIAGYLGMTQDRMRQRMQPLVRAGLVTQERPHAIPGVVWLPTAYGVQVAGLDLPVPTFSQTTFAHTLGLVDIGIRFEAAGETVVTEREIRAADTRERPTDRMRRARDLSFGRRRNLFVTDLGGGYSHVPDMALVRAPAEDGSPQSVGIELELSRKRPTEWRKILRGYRDSGSYAMVLYFTHRRDIRDGIVRAATDLGMEDQVEIRRFTPAQCASSITTGGQAA